MNEGNNQITRLNEVISRECKPLSMTVEWHELITHMQEIVSIEAQMDELKQRRLDVKALAPALLESLYNQTKAFNVDSKYVASILYWWGKGLLNAKDVGAPLGLHPSTGNTFYPLVVDTCDNCGEGITQTSHSNRPYLHQKLCRDCQDAENTTKERQRELQEMERRNRLEQLRTMPYRDYLQTDEWKEKRLIAMKRANFRCQVCNGKGQLNTHHRTYENRGNEPMKDLIVLCEPCHGIFHKQGKLAKEQ